MRGVYLLILMLAATAVSMSLAGWMTHPASGAAVAPVETPQRTEQQDCDRDDDVSVTVDGVYDASRSDYGLNDPPDYADGDRIWIGYTVTNASCHDVTVTVALNGSESGKTIHVASSSADPCTTGCTVSAMGGTGIGWDQWDLGKHPNATGEKVVATITIDAPADFSDTDTSNNSATSTDAINIVNDVPKADIGVKSVTASKTSALIGDDIDFTVTIRNDGDAEADVTVTLDHGDDTEELDSAEVSDLAAEGESTVTLSWDTDDAEAGEHSLRVLAETEGDGNSANDSKTVTVTLREPSIDVAVTGVLASSTEAIIGDSVDFTVSLENDGDVAVAPTVALYKGDETEALGSDTAGTIPAGGSETVTISWDTAGAEAGAHSVRAVATVADDDDSSNNSATASLTLHDPVDVQLRFTNPLASSVVKGNSVSVPFTLTNSGSNDAGEILVSLYVSENGQNQTTSQAEAAASETVAMLAVNASSSGTLTWDTTDANVDDYDLLLVATAAGDTDQANNLVSTSIEIRNWLALRTVSPGNAAAIVGETVEFTVQVENVGLEELTDVTVGLFEPNIPKALGSSTIPSITAGATAAATIEWNTDGRGAGALDLIVAAGADGQGPDGDDSQFVSLDIRNPIALSSAVLISTDNVAGSTVAINVEVLNESDAEVTDVAVDLFVGDSEKASDFATIASIAAGETVAASVTWDAADAEPGEYQLNVVASSASYNRDANDSVMLSVALRAPVMVVALTSATINRDVAAIGQTLEVVATVTNHGEAPVAVPVGLYLVERLQGTTAASTETTPLIQPGASSEVTLPWDSAGEDVGTHTLKIAAELPEDTTDDDNEELLEIELFRSAFDGTHDVDSCVEDVRVQITDIRDLTDQTRAPPNYYVGETLRAAYSVYNFSCQTDVTLVVTMNGPEGHSITDASALCFSDCVVPFGGKAEGEIAWAIPTLPALSNQHLEVAVTIASPSDFVDAGAANNSAESIDLINIVHPDDVVLRLGEQTVNKISARKSLTSLGFGVVDVRLISVNPLQTTAPFAADSAEIVVEVANDGPTTEPATLRFVLAPGNGESPRELHRQEMVIPTGQTRTETVEVPLRDVLPGVHTVEVLLSAAVDQSTGNNAATFELTLTGPTIEVGILDVAVSPDVLVLGDDATVSLAVRNESEIALPLKLELYVDDDAEPTGTKSIGELAPDGQSDQVIGWRVPVSAPMLGNHTLRLVASSGDFGAVATVNEDVTLHIDAEVLRINASPTGTAMQGQEVAIEVEVQNNGPAAVNVPVTLHFPSETKNPETDHAPTPARSTGTASFTWKTTNYTVGEHMLTATVPDQHNIASGETSMELPFRVSPLVVTATIVDVSVYPTAPMAGEPVSIAVTVRNDGPVATNIPVTLHFPPGGRQPDTRQPPLDPGETGTAVFEWLTGNYRPGTHQFLAEVAAVDTPQRRFTIELLPIVENVALVDMGTYPHETAMVGEPVEVWMDVRNDGPVALNVPVRLTFPSASKRPEVQSSRVNPGETVRVWFEWKTSNYDPGIHTLRAAVLLDSNVTLGSTTREVRFALTPRIITATILGHSVDPEEPRVGEPVTITVTLRNDGRIAANVPITLHFPPGGRQPDSRKHRLDPGETGTVVFEWLTGNFQPGTHQFLIELAGIDAPQRRFTIDLLPIVENVALVDMGTYPHETAMVGEPVEVWIDVRNDGPVALNVPVRLTFPSADKRPEVRSPRVAPGETVRVWFEWKTSNYEPGIHTLRAAVLLDSNVTLGRTSDEVRFALTPLLITATILGHSVDPEEPRVGEPVTITVTVRNDGRIAANIPVTLHFPSSDKQPETRRPRIAPGAASEVSFTWRTGRYEPGIHAFVVEVASDPPATREFNVELLPPMVDVAIVGMGSDPSKTAVRGQEVKIWVDVINNGPSALNVPVQLSFPSSDKQPGRKSTRIEPGEIVRVEFTWKTSNYDPGIHALTATILAEYNITDLDTSATIQIRLISARLMASIVGISWDPVSPVVGEPVRITVTVRNDGLVAASIPITLHFPPGGRQPDSRRPHLDPGETGTVVFEWLTGNYRPGTHQFLIELAAIDTPQRRFTIELLPIVEDVALVDMGTYPHETAMVGEPVEVWIDVRNDGPVALNVPVRLTFPSASKRPEVRSPRVAPGETVRVWFEWKTSNYEPGIHSLRAAVLLDSNITLGRTTEEVRFVLTPLVITATIVDFAVNPEEPRVGEPVSIAVRVRNDGPVATTIPVTLHFPSSDKQPETRRPRIDPGATSEVSFTWRTSRYEPGVHAFVVEVGSDPPATREFNVELLPPIVDVAIVGMGSDPSEMAVRGQEVKIWVDVVNNGPSALNVPVQLSFPSSDKQPGQKSTRIEPGKIARVEFTWKTSNYDPGIYALTATLLAEYNITELDTSATIQIQLIPAQLIASIVNISWSPESPVVGEPVRVTVTVRNDGIVAANIPVTLHFPSGDRQPETRRPRVAPGAVGTAGFTWRTSRYEPGDHVFRVLIAGVAGAARTFEIGLRPPEVDFAILGFDAPDPLHPIVKGDWVQITVMVQNQGPYAGRGTVYLLNAADLGAMYERSASLEPGESREVEFTWKTLRYPVGGYELLARVDAEYDIDPDNDESDRVRVHLLTDRDITVGFGNNVRPAVFAEPVSEADLASIARYRNDILVVGNRQTPIDRPIAAESNLPKGVSPKPASENYDPARMYWQWRAAQLSPWACARYQGAMGENLPRAVLCPRAPSVVR